VGQLVAKSIARGGIRKVAAFFAPANNRIHHAADQLPHGSFPLRGAGLSVKIFADDDVRRRLRPALRYFDILLLENRDALFVPDQRGALFPFDLVEGRNFSVREVTLKHEPGCLCRVQFAYRLAIQCRLHRCHPKIPPAAGSRLSEGGTLIFYSPARQGAGPHSSPAKVDFWVPRKRSMHRAGKNANGLP
jgi:hypothetical protein